MNAFFDAPIGIIALLLLLALSILTVSWCISDNKEQPFFEDLVEFYFTGRAFLYALSSSIGSVFSVTYLIGAALIFGGLYKSWLLIILVFGGPFIIFVYIKIISSAGNAINFDGNIITYYAKRWPEVKQRNFLISYLIIYFALLVEELAVSRLLFTSMFQNRPNLVAMLLVIMTLVIVVFIYSGGFRTIQRADAVQTVLIFCLLTIFLFLIYRDKNHSEVFVFEWPSGVQYLPLAILSWFLMFVSWFASSFDFYSRLNYEKLPNADVVLTRKRFAYLSVLLLVIVLGVGFIFGSYLTNVMRIGDKPSDYTNALVVFMFGQKYLFVKMVFIVGIFSMIFTTLNTLMITVMQCLVLVNKKHSARVKIINIMVLASVVSCLIPLDYVSSYGIFAGSLMVVPFVAILSIVSRTIEKYTNSLHHYLYTAPIVALIFYIYYLDTVTISFNQHFIIPLISAASLLLTLLVERAITAHEN